MEPCNYRQSFIFSVAYVFVWADGLLKVRNAHQTLQYCLSHPAIRQHKNVINNSTQ